MKELTESECAYLTGIIEGEGCVRIDNVAPGKGKPKTGWRPTIHVTQKGKKLIYALHEIFPGQIITSHSKDAKHKDNFRIAWSWGKVYYLMEKILPFMKGPKKEQVELVLRFHTHIKEGNHNYLTEEELEWRNTQLKLLGYLKKKID